jgi:hypothetical protein
MRWVQFLTEQSYRVANEIALSIRLFPATAPPFRVMAVLDTGAENTFLDNSLASRLGIADVTTGTHTTVHEASDRSSDGFIHDVDI